METQDNIHKGWRTRQEKEEIILQWQQSGKSRKEFCEAHHLKYNSLVTWCKQLKDKKSSAAGFSEVKVKAENNLFAQVHLPSGIKIDFFHSIPVDFLKSLLK
jgi:hypothetical protein